LKGWAVFYAREKTRQENFDTVKSRAHPSEPFRSTKPFSHHASYGITMSSHTLKSTDDLRPSERRFLAAMQEIGYGRFESLRILRGELVLAPWPATVRIVKFGNPSANTATPGSSEFELKKQVAEFFGHVRAIDSAIIRILEVRGGLPFSMDLAEGDQ
jgi:hypothetical protein